MRRLEGDAYRTVVGAKPRDRRRFLALARNHRAEALQQEILERIEARQWEHLGLLHNELASLGFGRTSLALRAQQAQQQEDLLAELRARRRLADLLPHGDPRAGPSLDGYARALEAVWFLEEAMAIRRAACPEKTDVCADGWLSQAAQALSDGDWIAEADQPVPVLIDAATVIERAFRGRWILDSAAPLTMADGPVTAHSLAAKIAEARSDAGRPRLPNAVAHPPWWLSRARCERHETVLFGRQLDATVAAFRLAAPVRDDRFPATVTSTVVLDVAPPSSDAAPEDHNQQALRMYEEAADTGPDDPWLGESIKLLTAGLRRLRTEALAPWPG